MTKEKARKAAEVLMAYADGKEVEFKEFRDTKWQTFKYNKDRFLCFNFDKFDYRIKKEPTYRPFKDKEECWNEMQKHQPFGWVYYGNHLLSIIGMDCRGIDILDEGRVEYIDYKDCFQFLIFHDGAPFGIKED